MASLIGKRVVITRPRHQSAALMEPIQKRGGRPICIPVIEIAPLEDFTRLDQALRQVQTYDWLVLTSVNGVNAVWERFEALDIQPLLDGVQVAAIGPKTAAALEQRGVTPDFVPDEYIAHAILPGLGDIRGQCILLLRADIARTALAQEIQAAGGLAADVSAYRTLPAEIEPEAWARIKTGVDVVIFTSSSTVTHFVRMLGERGFAAHSLPGDPWIACIGPITAATASDHGLRVDIMPQAYTIEGLISALDAFEIEREVEAT